MTLAALAAPTVAQDYVVIELYPLAGASNIQAHDVNANGEIVGELIFNSKTQAFVWLPFDAYGMDAGMHLLDDDFTNFAGSRAMAINDDGLVVGGVTYASGTFPYIWDLDTSDGDSSTEIDSEGHTAFDINNAASPVVVGGQFSDPPAEDCVQEPAFQYNVSTQGLTTLSASATSKHSIAFGINTPASGGHRVAGAANWDADDFNCGSTEPDCHGEIDGEFWGPSGSGMLKDLGVHSGSNAAVIGFAVNPAGRVVGAGNDPNDLTPGGQCRRKALVWDSSSPSTTVTVLPRIDENQQNPVDQDEAFDVRGTESNLPMEIVGWSKATFQALLWSWNGSSWDLVNLNDGSVACKTGILGTLRQATGISVAGWIAGQSSGTSWLLIPEDEYHTNICPADFANNNPTTCPDGQVDVFDLFVLLNNWGTDGDGAALAAPTNVVDVFDLFEILNSWGVCIGDPPPSPGLQTVVEDAGLTMDDWDEFEDVMVNGDEKDKENYNCWMQRYLSGCTTCPPCPDDDPFDD